MYSGFSSSVDESESVDSDFDNFDEDEDFADDEGDDVCHPPLEGCGPLFIILGKSDFINDS